MCCFTLLIFIFFNSILSVMHNVEGLKGETILGGDDSYWGQFTYVVSVQINNEHACGGSILASKFVVTAAHCFVDDNFRIKLNPVKVLAGTNDLRLHTESKVFVDVDTIYFLKDYFYNKKDTDAIADIVLLKLKNSLPFSSNRFISKLKLPPSNQNYFNKTAIVTGFGWDWVQVEFNKNSNSTNEVGGSRGRLRYAKTKVFPQNACESRYKTALPKELLCAQIVQRKLNKPEGICAGDSGSPLVYNHKILIGIVNSSPDGCSEQQKPGIYARVSKYSDLILKAAKNKPDSRIIPLKLV